MSYTVPYSFIPGTKARAQEVNANFNALTGYCDDFESGKANINLSNLSSDGIEVIKNNTSLRNLGELVISPIPLTDYGLHILDGSIIQKEGIYEDFVNYIETLYNNESDANYFISENDWQTSVTTYGVCGKFVYNSTNNTVRLPKITGIVEGTTDLTALGNLVEAGLPNITGSFGVTSEYQGMTPDGAFYSGSTPAFGDTKHNDFKRTNFDASRSSSVYGNSSTVQPQAVKVLYYIVIATTAKTDIQVDIDEIATDLNGKADTDLTNSTPTSSFATSLNNAGIRTVTEEYQNGDSWYRVYSDKWCEQGGRDSSGSGLKTITLLKNFTNTNYSIQATSESQDSATATSYANRATSSFQVRKSNSNCIWTAYGHIN